MTTATLELNDIDTENDSIIVIEYMEEHDRIAMRELNFKLNTTEIHHSLKFSMIRMFGEYLNYLVTVAPVINDDEWEMYDEGDIEDLILCYTARTNYPPSVARRIIAANESTDGGEIEVMRGMPCLPDSYVPGMIGFIQPSDRDFLEFFQNVIDNYTLSDTLREHFIKHMNLYIVHINRVLPPFNYNELQFIKMRSTKIAMNMYSKRTNVPVFIVKQLPNN